MAYSWDTPKTSVLKFDVALNENGNIKQEGENAAGKKAFSIAGIKTDATFDKADAVYNEIYGKIAGATYDKATGTLTTVYTVKGAE